MLFPSGPSFPYRTLFAAGVSALALSGPPAVAQTPGVPEVIALWLVDADTDTRLYRLDDYQSLNLAFVPANLTIEAEADADTQSVRFTIDNVPGALHSVAPYAMGADSDGDFDPVPALRQPGWIKVTATPYAADGGAGAAGAAFTRNLYRLQTDFVVDSVSDLADAHPGDGKCEALQLFQPVVTLAASQVTPQLQAKLQAQLHAQLESQLPSPAVAAGAVASAAAVAVTNAAAGAASGPSAAARLDPGEFASPGARPPSTRPGLALRRVCTLRAAIEEANAMPGRQTISLDGRNDRVYRITRGQLSITEGLAIYGHDKPTVDAERRSRLMWISGPEGGDILVDLVDLDLANGDAGSLDRGGVLHVQQATAQITRSIIRGGEGNFGGGIYLQYGGNATLTHSLVKGNKAGSPESFGGGGVTQRGGGIFNLEGNVTIRQSAIVDNKAVRGGGVSNYGGLMRIENSSVLDNEARSLGGGIENRHNGGKQGRLHLSFSTVTGNQAGTSTADAPQSRVGGGIHNAGWAYMASSVVARNTEPFGAGNPHSSPDCYSPTAHDFKSYRNNVVGVINGNCLLGDYSSGTGFGIESGTDAAPLNPLLGTRVDAPLPHRVPLAGSPLVDSGGGAGAIYPCPATDMRGRPRPAGAGCEIGSAERQ